MAPIPVTKKTRIQWTEIQCKAAPDNEEWVRRRSWISAEYLCHGSCRYLILGHVFGAFPSAATLRHLRKATTRVARHVR